MKVGVYIDAQSIYAATWKLGQRYQLQSAKPDYETILGEALAALDEKLGVETDLVISQIYTVSRSKASAFKHAMSRIGFTVKSHTLHQGPPCAACERRVDSFEWDTTIAVDVLTATLAGDIDAVALVTGDAVFAPLAEALHDNAVPFVFMGYAGSTSPKLRNIVHLSRRCMYRESQASRKHHDR